MAIKLICRICGSEDVPVNEGCDMVEVEVPPRRSRDMTELTGENDATIDISELGRS